MTYSKKKKISHILRIAQTKLIFIVYNAKETLDESLYLYVDSPGQK